MLNPYEIKFLLFKTLFLLQIWYVDYSWIEIEWNLFFPDFWFSGFSGPQKSGNRKKFQKPGRYVKGLTIICILAETEWKNLFSNSCLGSHFENFWWRHRRTDDVIHFFYLCIPYMVDFNCLKFWHSSHTQSKVIEESLQKPSRNRVKGIPKWWLISANRMSSFFELLQHPFTQSFHSCSLICVSDQENITLINRDIQKSKLNVPSLSYGPSIVKKSATATIRADLDVSQISRIDVHSHETINA